MRICPCYLHAQEPALNLMCDTAAKTDRFDPPC